MNYEENPVPLVVTVRLFGFALLFLALLLPGRRSAIPSRLRMFSSHLWTMRNHLWVDLTSYRADETREQDLRLRPFCRSALWLGFPEDFAACSLIFGLELVSICSGFITRACALAIKFGCVPDFVFTFTCTRSSCSAESLFAALALPHTFALVE